MNTSKEAGAAWREYIKQFSKLNEFWQTIPEATNTWLSQQIDIFAGKYPASSFKEQDTSIERLRQWVIEQRNLAHVNCLEAEKQALNNVLVHIESLQNSQHHDN
jgi:hypothetical protein